MPSGSFPNINRPDEVIELELLRSELVYLGGLTVSRTTHQPGWRWSTHVRPHVGGEWCQTRHVGVTLSGKAHVVFQDGTERDFVEGAVIDVPPGHDAWVLGDDPLVDLTWTGARTWLPITDAGTDRVLATILFTDIVDSTSMAASVGDAEWAELMSSHEQRVRDTLARHGGREIKTTGDGVLAVFTGAGRAVRCARSLRQIANDLGLQLRQAIHSGEIDQIESDIRGIAVNETSRLLSLAQANEILVSATFKELTGSDFEWVDRGMNELRGLVGAKQLFALRD